MLTAVSKITDCVLEPTDQTKLLVTLTNSHAKATAKNVAAQIGFRCGKPKGFVLRPANNSFGDIAPKKSVTREFVVDTNGAIPSKKHDVSVSLSYDYLVRTAECEVISFNVGKD